MAKGRGKKKMKSFCVPVSVMLDGYIDVSASNKKEALKLAQEQYSGIDSLEYLDSEAMWPEGNDEIDEQIEENEEDE